LSSEALGPALFRPLALNVSLIRNPVKQVDSRWTSWHCLCGLISFQTFVGVLLSLLREINQALSWVLLGLFAWRGGDGSRFVGGRWIGSLLPFTVGGGSGSGGPDMISHVSRYRWRKIDM